MDPITIAALGIGGAGIASSLFGKQRKPQTVAYEGIGNLGQIGVADKEWLPALLERLHTKPEEWAGKYYDELFQPTAKQMRSEWGEQVEAPIMGAAGAMGQERASSTLGDISKETARREMELGKYGGELRTRGFEAGREEGQIGLSGLQDYISLDAQIRQNAANQQMRAGMIGEQGLQQYATSQQERLPKAILAAGNLATGVGGGGGEMDWLQELMKKRPASLGW